ncbi:MAG: GNAT family N-acetyltransferase [Pseudomonadota bacterium]
MTRAYLTPVPQADATRTALAALVPVLETERLTLRAPAASDWDTISPIWKSQRGQYIGGPFDEEDAWLDFAQAVAGWMLRGLGYWTITVTATGAPIGIIGIGAEVEDPELEFGWLLIESAEGQGYAFEAAQAVRSYAFDTLGMSTLISFVDRRNTRSAALARKLGATQDDSVLQGALAEEDFAFRHTPGALT